MNLTIFRNMITMVISDYIVTVPGEKVALLFQYSELIHMEQICFHDCVFSPKISEKKYN